MSRRERVEAERASERRNGPVPEENEGVRRKREWGGAHGETMGVYGADSDSYLRSRSHNGFRPYNENENRSIKLYSVFL